MSSTMKTKQVKFSSKIFFPHKTPYDVFFAKRVPLLQALKLALQNYNETQSQFFLGKLIKRQPFTIAECGVYVGAGLLSIAQSVKLAKVPYLIHALDTFTGLPPLSKEDNALAPKDAPYLTQQLFNDTSLEEVKARLSSHGFTQSIYYHQGLFETTLPTLPTQQYDFVNIDCDLYHGHLTCLAYFYPRMIKGGVIFFDDYHSTQYPMAKAAIDFFLKDKPENLLHLRYGEEAPNHTKSYLIKY